MTQTIVITSGKDGVGKTNISVNTALEISRQNFKTCLFDADLGLTKTGIISGLQPEYTLDDFIFEDKKLDEIILHSSKGIDIIPGSSDIGKTAQLSKETISDIISSFSQIESYDYFIIDTSSGISSCLIAFCLASSEIILVITSEATSLTEAYLLLKVLSLNGCRGTVKIIVNKCPSIPISERAYFRFETVVNKRLNIELILAGIILNDPNIAVAAREQKPLLALYPNSIASQCIRAMVSTLLENDPKVKRHTDFSEFWQHYFDFIQSDLLLTTTQPGNDTVESSLPEADHHQDVRLYFPSGPNTGLLLQKPVIPFSHSDGILNPLKLTSPAPLLLKSLELQARGELSKEELLKIFSSDPTLMVRALQMFSSSCTNESNRVTGFSQIFQKLGTEVLSNLLTTASIQRALTDQVITDNRFLSAFWHHSYKSALLAEQIAETIHYPYPEQAFLAGLIHDIGRLALQTEYPQVYAQFPYTLRDQAIVLETERLIFGQTHAQIGAKALRASRLDSFIVDAVQYHTEPDLRIKTGFELVKIIFIACRLTQFPQENMEHISDMGESLFGLTQDQLLTAARTADKKLVQISEHFHIPHNEKPKNSAAEKIEAHLRLQAIDCSILQGALPGTAASQKIPQIIRLVHQGLDILFGIKPVICLITDSQQSSLQAVGYPNCFGWEILSDIILSLESGNSLIVESFTAPGLKFAMNAETDAPLSLADEQIIRILGSQILVCVPIAAQAGRKGVIVFSIKKEELPNIQKQQERLEQFGARTANTLFASAQVFKGRKV
ncbi:MAG: HDOD domain-containing protein [Desulfobulbaceae bacterium]|nr:HDOD domain-containing protein [Desulfobulbaceae bacterium]